MQSKATIYLFLFFINCSPSDTKLEQYIVQGQQLYIKHCSNCHQTSGKGLGLLYPPLDQSDFIDNYQDQVICLIEFGIKGNLTVNGKNFNQPMPGLPQLTDLEIAEIVTFLNNSWGREKGIVQVTEISSILDNCKP